MSTLLAGIRLEGIEALRKEDYVSAVHHFSRFLEMNSNDAETLSNIGVAFEALRKHSEAKAAWERSVALKPDFYHPYYNLGKLALQLGEWKLAIENFKVTLALQGASSEVLHYLGAAFHSQGKFVEAVGAFREALRLSPHDFRIWNSLAISEQAANDFVAAEDSFKKCIKLAPDFPLSYQNLATLLKKEGRLAESIEYSRKALEKKPDFEEAHSELIYSLAMLENTNPEEVLKEAKKWEKTHAAPAGTLLRHKNKKDLSRRLRIGFVSADFRRHAAANLFAPVLEHLDRKSFEVFCFSDVRNQDDVTAHFKNLSDQWIDIAHFTDESVVAQVQMHEIDILVDLAGHTAQNRLRVFAHKPAPVQVTYLGYPGTTGLAAFDYRISDSYAEPTGEADKFSAEKIWRLEGLAYSFSGSYGLPETKNVSALPALHKKHVRFACFHHLSKINDEVLNLWAEILAKVSQSEILFVSAATHIPRVQSRITRIFEKHGVKANRILFRQSVPSQKYMDLYHEVDISLDSFPANGGVTSLHSLWMGVPVVSFEGKTQAWRLGTGWLSSLGRTEWLAKSKEEYKNIAVALAADIPKLSTIRKSLRQELLHSPILNHADHAKRLAKAFREMWALWCKGKTL